MTTSDSSVSFEETDTRYDEMHSTIEDWINDLVEHVGDAQASAEFQDWLDVQSRFHDYSYRNTLLINQQCPEATKVAGYRAWQEEFDRHVQEGEQAIWIWAPLIAKRCPACENSPSYHADAIVSMTNHHPRSGQRGSSASSSRRCSTSPRPTASHFLTSIRQPLATSATSSPS